MNSDKGRTIKVFILLLSKVTVCITFFKGEIKIKAFQQSDQELCPKKPQNRVYNCFMLRKIKDFSGEEVTGSRIPLTSARQHEVLAEKARCRQMGLNMRGAW